MYLEECIFSIGDHMQQCSGITFDSLLCVLLEVLREFYGVLEIELELHHRRQPYPLHYVIGPISLLSHGIKACKQKSHL